MRRGGRFRGVVRRALLRLALRRSYGSPADPAALLGRLPEEALLPLRRSGTDPVHGLTALQRADPVASLSLPLGIRGWLVTGYAETRAVLADAERFSNDFGNLVGRGGLAAEQHPGGLGFRDPPDHTRLRRLLTPSFTARAVAARGPRIEGIVARALDDVARRGEREGVVDLWPTFAVRVPADTIGDLLGIRPEEQEELRRLSTARFEAGGGTTASLAAVSASLDLLTDVVARERNRPGAGLLGSIVRDHGEDVGDRELAGLADGVLTGGLDTTASMLALGVVVLLRDPERYAALGTGSAAHHPRPPGGPGTARATPASVAADTGVDGLVEELLRYLAVVQVAFPRFARQDTLLGGHQVRAGDVVLCSLVGAGRDERVVCDGDRVVPGRDAPAHLAFGHGLHRCVGAELARTELRIAYPALARRFPDLRLAVPEDALPWRATSFVYGLDALPVHLS